MLHGPLNLNNFKVISENVTPFYINLHVIWRRYSYIIISVKYNLYSQFNFTENMNIIYAIVRVVNVNIKLMLSSTMWFTRVKMDIISLKKKKIAFYELSYTFLNSDDWRSVWPISRFLFWDQVTIVGLSSQILWCCV